MRSSGIPERWGWREMAKEIPQMKVQEVPETGGAGVGKIHVLNSSFLSKPTLRCNFKQLIQS